ncbi:hypothetical protein [Paraburkholderia sp.]|uniref:hypothetical protein n=1 Tax=Paraburkholderia sp. TaxID=1926495 RepID=UPI002D388B5A|nr:hypothetical protein [Paraburkholderia sp.]HZZ06631.1 hypothetical protein [Paraburkholderia sp.]
MKIFYMFLGVALLAVMTQTGASEIGSKTDLGNTLQNAVLCKPGTVDDPAAVGAFDGSDESMSDALTRLGVKVDSGDRSGDRNELYKKYTLPPGVTVFGYAAKRATFYAYLGAGSIFYVELAADRSELIKLKNDLRLARIRKNNEDYGYRGQVDAQYYKRVHSPTAFDPYPDTIVAGYQYKGGSEFIRIGCQEFDSPG